MFSPSVGTLSRRCEILDFDLTAHANRDDLLGLVADVDPRTVVLGHGDEVARNWMAEAILQRHPRMKILQPGPVETVDI